MLSGRISAGNARQLAGDIAGEQWREADRSIRQSATVAKENGCRSVLLSSEWLLGSLSRGQNLVSFAEIVKQAGSEKVSVLLIVRDPVEQLISHYKHRAKSGRIGSIAEWVKRDYLLPQRLAGIRQQLGEAGLELTVRAYSPEPSALGRIFFRDWLGVEAPEAASKLSVNPSLALSELVLLRQVARARPALAPELHARLASLDPGQKAHDGVWKEHARRAAEKGVAAHSGEWVHWNELLPVGERLKIPDEPDESSEEPQEVEFSQAQSLVLVRLLAEAATPRFAARLFWRSHLRPLLGKTARLLLPQRRRE